MREGTRVKNRTYNYTGTIEKSLGPNRWLVKTDPKGTLVEAPEGMLEEMANGNVPTRKSNEAILDEKMTSTGHTYVGTEVQSDGSSNVTYETVDGKYVSVRVRTDVAANGSGE